MLFSGVTKEILGVLRTAHHWERGQISSGSAALCRQSNGLLARHVVWLVPSNCSNFGVTGPICEAIAN